MARVLAFLLCSLVPFEIQAGVVLDFESLCVEDDQLHDHDGILEFDGFRLTSVPPPGNAFRFVSAGTQNGLFPGSTAIFNGQSNAAIVLEATDGSPFSLLSIDLAVLPPGVNDPHGPWDPGPFGLTFFGDIAGGGTVSQTFTMNNMFLSLETFVFSGFQNVETVTWYQGTGFTPPGPPGPGEIPTHQFDNVVLDVPEVSPVPEPSSMAIFGGLAVLCAARQALKRRLSMASACWHAFHQASRWDGASTEKP